MKDVISWLDLKEIFLIFVYCCLKNIVILTPTPLWQWFCTCKIKDEYWSIERFIKKYDFLYTPKIHLISKEIAIYKIPWSFIQNLHLWLFSVRPTKWKMTLNVPDVWRIIGGASRWIPKRFKMNYHVPKKICFQEQKKPNSCCGALKCNHKRCSVVDI